MWYLYDGFQEFDVRELTEFSLRKEHPMKKLTHKLTTRNFEIVKSLKISINAFRAGVSWQQLSSQLIQKNLNYW